MGVGWGDVRGVARSHLGQIVNSLLCELYPVNNMDVLKQGNDFIMAEGYFFVFVVLGDNSRASVPKRWYAYPQGCVLGCSGVQEK